MRPITLADIQFTPELSEKAIETAMRLFRLRQERNIHAEVNPAWETLVGLYYQKALLNERGDTEQQQCIMQAIRLTVWESGQIPASWPKAFPLPYAKPQVSAVRGFWQKLQGWYRQARDTWRQLRSRFNGRV